uniref:Uncharacterized protein n=1 Tax=Parascaris equorum TaxID=6256 RepID=A0A914RF61_PAREQ
MLFLILTFGLADICAGEIHFKKETQLKNVKQLTFGGQNAEGYFSFDGKWLTFQAAGMEEYGTLCDQIYRIDLTLPPKEQTPHRISTGNTSYTWDLFPDYDIFKVNEFGKVVTQLTTSAGYDAEGAVSPDGRHIVFTSMRTGDPEIWIMNSDGTDPRQNSASTVRLPAYLSIGSYLLSQDILFWGSEPASTLLVIVVRILFTCTRFTGFVGENKIQKAYVTSVPRKYNLVSPLAMELYSMNIDGTNLRKITSLGGSNWAPFYLPDNRRIIFSSNFNSTASFGSFDLYLIDDDGDNLERVGSLKKCA